MKAPIKDFEVTLKLRNNHLKKRRLALGLSIKNFAAFVGVAFSSYQGLETMAVSPLAKNGQEWKPIVLKLSDFYKVHPKDLFPEAILGVKAPKVVKEVSVEEIAPILSGGFYTSPSLPSEILEMRENEELVRSLLADLPPRERKIIENRFGFSDETKSHVDFSKEFGLSRTRIGHLEQMGIRRLRHKLLSRNTEVSRALVRERTKGQLLKL